MPQTDLAQRLLADVTRAAENGATLEEAMSGALRVLGELTGFELGQVWRPSPNGRALRCEPAAYHAREPERLAPFRRVSLPLAFSFNEGLIGKSWSLGEPVWLEDVAQEYFVRGPKALAVGLKSGFAFPVKSGPHVLAVYELLTTRSQPAPTELIQVLGPLAVRLGEVFGRKPAGVARA